MMNVLKYFRVFICIYLLQWSHLYVDAHFIYHLIQLFNVYLEAVFKPG